MTRIKSGSIAVDSLEIDALLDALGSEIVVSFEESALPRIPPHPLLRDVLFYLS